MFPVYFCDILTDILLFIFLLNAAAGAMFKGETDRAGEGGVWIL